MKNDEKDILIRIIDSLYEYPMHVITRKRLNEFIAHKDKTAKPALERWYRRMKQNDFQNPDALLQMFPRHSVDQVDDLTVFNIGALEVKPLSVSLQLYTIIGKKFTSVRC